MIDTWEAFQSYQRTAVVLDHVDYEINTVLGGVQTEDGGRRNVRILLLAGSDLISTMSEPGVWSYQDVRPFEHPLPRRSQLIISSPVGPHSWTIRLLNSRKGRDRFRTSPRQSGPLAKQHPHHLPAYTERCLQHQGEPSFDPGIGVMIFNCVQVRLFIRRGLSVRYLLPTSVVEYIEQNGLYLDDSTNAAASSAGKGKERDQTQVP